MSVENINSIVAAAQARTQATKDAIVATATVAPNPSEETQKTNSSNLDVLEIGNSSNPAGLYKVTSSKVSYNEAVNGGLRMTIKPADDGVGLKSQHLGLGEAIKNANDGINIYQPETGALGEIHDVLSTIKLKSEQLLQTHSDQTANSLALAQSDIYKSLDSLLNLTEYDIDFSTAETTAKSIEKIEGYLKAITDQQSKLREQMTSTVTDVSTTRAESIIRDVDFAEESSIFTKSQMLSQAAQAEESNTAPGSTSTFNRYGGLLL